MPTNKTPLQQLVKSKVKALAEARKLDLSQIEQLIDVLSEAAHKKREELSSKRKKAINQVTQIIFDAELSPKDIEQSMRARVSGKGVQKKQKASPKAKKVLAPKYRLEIDGQEHLWTGRGRMPVVFREYFERGNTRESCLIGAKPEKPAAKKQAKKAPAKKKVTASKAAAAPKKAAAKKAAAKKKPAAKKATPKAKTKSGAVAPQQATTGPESAPGAPETPSKDNAA